MARTTQKKTTKDAWRKRYYQDNHMSLVDDHLLLQVEMKLVELQLCAKRINDPSLTRIYNDLNQYSAMMSGKTADFNLQKERLPEDIDGVFTSAFIPPQVLIK
jgi:hypothetical protein